MTIQSSNLLPALRELPGGDESGQNRSFRDNITGIVNMDRAMYAAEFAAGISAGMWGVFDSLNVDDTLRENLIHAHEWPSLIIKGPLLNTGKRRCKKGHLLCVTS